MIQGPSRYAPERRPEEAKTRRNIVLGAMVRDGSITLDQAAIAARESVAVAPLNEKNRALAPWFVDYVNRFGDSASAREAGENETKGRTYTTIDLDLQQLAENALEHQLSKLDEIYKERGAGPQAALVALDPHTGNVLAMVGGRDYSQSQLNRVTDARRQPGSTFKPFVYAAALNGGMSQAQMFVDSPREFHYDHNKVYRPVNYGGGFSMREVTMRTALVKSLNVVTVDVAMQTGLAHIANLAEEFGLPKPARYPSLALGTTEVTPLELAAAYAAFVNGGTRVEPKPSLAPRHLWSETGNQADHCVHDHEHAGSSDRSRNGPSRARQCPGNGHRGKDRYVTRRLVCRLYAESGVRGVDWFR